MGFCIGRTGFNLRGEKSLHPWILDIETIYFKNITHSMRFLSLANGRPRSPWLRFPIQVNRKVEHNRTKHNRSTPKLNSLKKFNINLTFAPLTTSLTNPAAPCSTLSSTNVNGDVSGRSVSNFWMRRRSCVRLCWRREGVDILLGFWIDRDIFTTRRVNYTRNITDGFYGREFWRGWG